MVDNTTLGAKSFEKKLEEEGLGGRDLRNVFEWKGEGVPGAEECSPDDSELFEPANSITVLTTQLFLVINFQFTSGTTGLPKAFVFPRLLHALSLISPQSTASL